MDMVPKDLEGARNDALYASKIDPDNGKHWRVLAEVEEEMGEISKAIEAVQKWAEMEPVFLSKAKKEMSRLQVLKK